MLIYRFINKFHSSSSVFLSLPCLNHPRNSYTCTFLLFTQTKHSSIPPRRAINIQWFPSSQISSGLLRAMWGSERQSVSGFRWRKLSRVVSFLFSCRTKQRNFYCRAYFTFCQMPCRDSVLGLHSIYSTLPKNG
jgi:hypothetical protein